MSGSETEEDQCNRTRESNIVAMGDVLAKKHSNDSPNDICTVPTDDDLTRDYVGELLDIEELAVTSPMIADSVPLVSMTDEESVIDAFIKGARDAECQYPIDMNSEVLLENSCVTMIADNSSRSGKESSSDICKTEREMLREVLQRTMKFQNSWTELRQHIRAAFNVALENSRNPNGLQLQHNTLCTVEMHDTVLQLCKGDPWQLFTRLVNQAQEFVVEVKVRLLALLHDCSVNNLAEIFLTGLLDDYDALISTTSQISELVKSLKEHLGMFNLSWDCFSRKLYQLYVYNDPLVQNNLPRFIGQLRKLLPLKGSEYQGLVHRYLALDDEMTRIVRSWPETIKWMEQYNAKQAVRITRIRQIREDWELFTSARKLIEQRVLIRSPEMLQALQDIASQFSTLVSHGKVDVPGTENRPQNQTLESTLDSFSMPSSIEVLQILLDDFNKAQQQKFSIIPGSLTGAVMDYIQLDETDCNSGQFVRSVRSHNDECSKNNTGDGKCCECHVCTRPPISPVVKRTRPGNTETAEGSVIPSPFSDRFIEETAIRAATIIQAMKQVKKKSEGTETRVLQVDGTDLDNITEDIELRMSEPQPCSCVYRHAREIAERKNEFMESPPPCPCLLYSKRKWDTCPCLTEPVPKAVVSNGHPKPVSPSSSVVNVNQKRSKRPVKTGPTQSVQRQRRHSTTQTRSTSHNHSTHQGTGIHPHTHGPLPDLVKNTGTNHRPHTHNNHTSHACHKQANVQHIKRVSCNDLSSGDGDCSDSGSSQEDSCSTSSSAQRDSSRHCDCCYCEVFGHGVPPVAPVSRNYNEMRERLRQLLTKKKAIKCKATCSQPKSSSESLPSSASNEIKAISNSAPRSNTPVSVASIAPPEQLDQRNLDELLEFIEGNQNGKKDNNKKAEKKARQKQRKIEEKLKTDRQEVERQKLIELQKKTPEVTITVVDPQKPIPQRSLPQSNLPEVSILPTSPPVALPAVKQLNNKKKDKHDVCSNSSNTSSSSCSSSTSGSSINNKTKTAPVNTNLKNKSINTSKIDRSTSSSSQASKGGTKNERAELPSKNNKTLASSNSMNVKNNSISTVERSLTVDLTDKKLTKKERKKLRREMRNLEEAKLKALEKPVQMEPQPQIVTIKRVMESNSAEPTVTITLKGQTPAEDKVLFTLINGQTKEHTATQKLENERNQSTGGKKKKNKANNNSNSNNNNYPLQQGNKIQQTNNSKQQQNQNKISDNKSLKQQMSNEKSKGGKQTDEKKGQQQTNGETKHVKSKKDKKNTENKENVMQHQNAVNKNKNQQQNVSNKKQCKTSTPPQTPVSQKPSNNSSIMNEATGKKKKGQQLDKNSQLNANKNNKNTSSTAANKLTKTDNQKVQIKANQVVIKQRSPSEIQTTPVERVSSPLSSQFKDIGSNTKINIENLKLPPGITITKVDVPAKPLPIKSAPMPKPVNPPKQTTIIAAPMSGVQSSYASPQAGGNVIVVDTGKLKQDLLPKPVEKELPKESQQQTQSTSGKKKKKKNKNAANANNVTSTTVQNNDNSTSDQTDEPARILHNPGTNMVTIRNPAFGPMKVPPTQQAAIIKVSENGMVTIRSPALQQAINAGLTSPPKPDYIVKGDLPLRASNESINTNLKHTNGMIPSSLAELRSRLTPDCTALTGLANIQISKVTNGQPIPENGINLKGTSVTLTKVRTENSMEEMQSAKSAAREAISASLAVSSSSKSKKKKKRGSETRQCGDDWNLVESVFTPKDIDLEDGEMDDAERELEAFKRFCLQSVPPPRKEKVNLNIKDIVLKKKSSSSSSSTAAAVIAAN